MNIVVTGSAGRMGRRLVASLLADGHTVIGFDRVSADVRDERYREVCGELSDAAAAADALADARAVVHLGAFMSWVAADADRVRRANVDGTRTLLDAMAAAGVRRLVFGSSGEVYPELFPRYQPLDEAHPRAPRSIYGLSKMVGEDLVDFHTRAHGLEGTVLRFSHTQDAAELLDPESFFSGARFFLRGRLRQQRAFGNQAVVDLLEPRDDGTEKLLLSCNENGEPFRMGISDTRDIVAGIRLALDAPEAIGRTFNLCPDRPVEFEEALQRMADITGLPVERVDLPGPGVRYETSNRAVRETLGYRPEWPFERMLDEAAERWRSR